MKGQLKKDHQQQLKTTKSDKRMSKTDYPRVQTDTVNSQDDLQNSYKISLICTKSRRNLML